MSVFKIVNDSGQRLDLDGKVAVIGEGAQFKTLEEIDKWASKMNFEFNAIGDDGRWVSEDRTCINPETGMLECRDFYWFNIANMMVIEFAKVGFNKWQWRHTRNGWACKCYDDKNGWVLNENLKEPAS